MCIIALPHLSKRPSRLAGAVTPFISPDFFVAEQISGTAKSAVDANTALVAYQYV